MRRRRMLFGTGIALAVLSSSTAVVAATGPTFGPNAVKLANIKSATAMVNGKRIESFRYIIAKNPQSGKTMTWIPAMNVQDILTNAGIVAHWIPGVNQLQLNMPEGWTLPKTFRVQKYNEPLAGQFDVILNATSVAYAPVLTVKNVPGEVCVPINELMSVLKRLGISSTWRSGMWTLTGKVAVPQARSIAAGETTFVKLTLKNQINPFGQPAPLAVAPVSPVSITLPVNPAFQTSNTPFGMDLNSVPGENYLQTGKMEYVTKNSLASAERWMAQAFAKLGYKEVGTSSTGDYKTGYSSEALVFAPKTEPRTTQLEVQVNFRTTKSNETLMEYFVTDVVLPPRPVSSLIHGQVSSVAVTVTKNWKTTTHTTITNTTSIQSIVKAVNALQLISPYGVNPGGPAITELEGATMVFHMADGQRVTVQATMENNDEIFGDVSVGKVPLQDNQGSVWKAMESALS